MSSTETTTQKRGLGRGLGSLLGDAAPMADKAPSRPSGSREINLDAAPAKPAPVAAQVVPDEARIWLIGIEKLKPNVRQPRKEFDRTKIDELAASIKEKGILQPIVVRRASQGFEIIAGERRWRAAQAAGLHEVPVIIRKADDQDTLELALIENIQRHDLNPIDEAEAYDLLATEFGLTQDKIAQKVGKDRATVANSMRLLGLSPQVKDFVREGALSPGHAKVILSVVDHTKQLEFAKKILNLKLSVRAAESFLKTLQTPKEEKSDKIGVNVSQRLVNGLSEELQKILGTKVQIDYSKGAGKVLISFFSDEELTPTGREASGNVEELNEIDTTQRVTALLDQGAAFEGQLTFEGTVRIGGKFRGEIFTKDTLVIDPGAEVEAQIEADTVIISGIVKGNVFARRRVIMHPPAVLKGTVTTPSLRIDEGVVFEGASYMAKG